MGYSRFGEFMRILRIKNHEVMGDTAKVLEVSVPFLSNVENGKRRVPNGWLEKLTAHYHLNEEEMEELKKHIEESKTKVKIEISNCEGYRRKAALAFQRSFDTLGETQANKILKILEDNK